MLYSRISIFILLALAALLVKGAWNVYGKERDSREALQRSERDLTELRTREAALREELQRLQTAGGIEAEIRKQFQVAKPGERMVVIVGEEGEGAEAAPPSRTLLSRFLGLFR